MDVFGFNPATVFGVVNALALLALVASVFLTRRSTDAAVKASNVVVSEHAATHRAWLGIDGFPEYECPLEGLAGPVSLLVTVKNFGTLPASIQTMSMKFEDDSGQPEIVRDMVAFPSDVARMKAELPDRVVEQLLSGKTTKVLFHAVYKWASESPAGQLETSITLLPSPDPTGLHCLWNTTPLIA